MASEIKQQHRKLLLVYDLMGPSFYDYIFARDFASLPIFSSGENTRREGKTEEAVKVQPSKSWFNVRQSP